MAFLSIQSLCLLPVLLLRFIGSQLNHKVIWICWRSPRKVIAELDKSSCTEESYSPPDTWSCCDSAQGVSGSGAPTRIQPLSWCCRCCCCCTFLMTRPPSANRKAVKHKYDSKTQTCHHQLSAAVAVKKQQLCHPTMWHSALVSHGIANR